MSSGNGSMTARELAGPRGRHDWGRRLLQFAILSDTHMRPPEGGDIAPWEVNRRANDRSRWVVAQISKWQPEFVVHLGDVVHPFPHLPQFSGAAAAAKEILSAFTCPLYFVPGNHDVGDKKNPMMPAHIIDDFSIDHYKQAISTDHTSFDANGLHFVLINCQLIGSGLAREQPHAEWLERDLAQNAGKRIFLFTHSPPFILSDSEPSYYDNLDEPGRSWLLGLIRKYNIEIVFAGHVHNFMFHRIGPTELMTVPSTTFVRQDYSELFRISAADQHGRNDAAKLGWCEVEIFERGHVVRVRRSYGAETDDGHAGSRLPVRHMKELRDAPVGVQLRHPWFETVSLPYNGPQDEFVRRLARNDYPVLALWESGVRKLRAPVGDLCDATSRNRMQDLVEAGHEFTLFSFDLPDKQQLAVLREYRHLYAAYEVVLAVADVKAKLPSIDTFAKKLNVPCVVTKIVTSADRRPAGSAFAHAVAFGLEVDEALDIRDVLRDSNSRLGLTLRIAGDRSAWKFIEQIDAWEQPRPAISLNIQLGIDNPAFRPDDDLFVANRVAETAIAAASVKDVHPFIDTFVDHDRGFFPRNGLYDRRYNPRMGALVLGMVHTFLNIDPGTIVLGQRSTHDGFTACAFTKGQSTCLLVEPDAPLRLAALTHLLRHTFGSAGSLEWLCLQSGRISPVDLTSPEDVRAPVIFHTPATGGE